MTDPILVVDDLSSTRRLVAYGLQSVGLETIGAGSATEAIDLARAHHFSLALVDINLPDQDGFAVIRQLRLIPHMQDIPIIVFTARSNPEDEKLAETSGAMDILYKPFSMQQLRGMMTRYLPSE